MIKKRLFTLLTNSKKYIFQNIIYQWIALLSQILIIFVITDVIQQYFNHENSNYVLRISLVIVAFIIRFICDRCATKAIYLSSNEVKTVLRNQIYAKLLRLGSSYKEQVNTSQIVQLATEGVEQLETYTGRYLPQLFYSLLAPITLFIFLFHISMKTTVVLLVCVPLIPVSIVVVQKIAKKLLSKYWTSYTQLGDSFLENLQGLKTLKIYQADSYYAKKMDEEANHFRIITMKVLTMQLNSTSVMDIIAYGGAAIGMILILIEYMNGSIVLKDALRIILLSAEFFIPLRLLGSYFHIAMNGMAASDKIFALLDLEEPKYGNQEILDTNITISNLSFSYQTDKEILHDINIHIPTGSFISLVGESGSGKSTIAGILTSKNRSYQGNVKIGNIDLKNIQETSLKNNITLITHNSYLFKGTVYDNLKMGNEKASKEEMIEVLKKVNLDSFIASQNGLDTRIDERGDNLSGGQKQRLAIARGLLHNSPIYIFDEATSNIDMESEEIIMEAIHELAKTKTILMISHRLANVVHSDQIYYLKNGTIQEKGTQEELMKLNQGYASLYHQQIELENYGGNVQ